MKEEVSRVAGFSCRDKRSAVSGEVRDSPSDRGAICFLKGELFPIWWLVSSAFDRCVSINHYFGILTYKLCIFVKSTSISVYKVCSAIV